jgi:ribose 5-phosphate isomerase B
MRQAQRRIEFSYFILSTIKGEKQMKIVIANDHTAVEMKNQIMEYVRGLGHEVVNFGTDSTQSCHYPEYGEKVGRAVAAGEFDCGILICGTGVGISIAANKVNGVRAAVCSDVTTASLVKQHNDANIIAFGARIVGLELAKDIVKAYLDAEFLGERHKIRVDMFTEIENRNK